jgi:hypothetical protein
MTHRIQKYNPSLKKPLAFSMNMMQTSRNALPWARLVEQTPRKDVILHGES